MKTYRILYASMLFLFLYFLLSNVASSQQEIERADYRSFASNKLYTEINNILLEERISYSVDLREEQKIEQRVRNWVSTQLDFEKATFIESTNYKNRATFIQKIKGIDNTQTMLTFRDEPRHFSFYNLSAQHTSKNSCDRASSREIINDKKRNKCIKLAKYFVLSNKFVNISSSDQIGKTYVKILVRNCSSELNINGIEIPILYNVKLVFDSIYKLP